MGYKQAYQSVNGRVLTSTEFTIQLPLPATNAEAGLSIIPSLTWYGASVNCSTTQQSASIIDVALQLLRYKISTGWLSKLQLMIKSLLSHSTLRVRAVGLINNRIGIRRYYTARNDVCRSFYDIFWQRKWKWRPLKPPIIIICYH